MAKPAAGSLSATAATGVVGVTGAAGGASVKSSHGVTNAATVTGVAVKGASANLARALSAAAAALGAVRAGQALDEALARATQALPPPERAAAQDIAYHACRCLNLLDALAGGLMKKPNPLADDLLRVSLSELISHPDRAHTIVDQAVSASASRTALKPLVNGVLRTYLREAATRLAAARRSEAVRLQYPQWWITRVRTAWPQQWESILAAGNTHAPMTLRVNRRCGSAEQYARELEQANIAAERVGTDAFRLARPQPAARLPGFAEGRVSVQDLGAQCAASLLDVHAGMRVLDACAAPGGKTAHILERTDCEVIALDRDAARLGVVQANLQRLHLIAQCRAADAAALDTWWDGAHFDRVLLDTPCTASGVIARHPDGKWLKRESDIVQLAREQARLLATLWRVLKPGGKLLYATCSVFPGENQQQIDSFLSTHPDARPGNLRFDDDAPLDRVDGQLLPGPAHGGFFYALLEKDRAAALE